MKKTLLLIIFLCFGMFLISCDKAENEKSCEEDSSQSKCQTNTTTEEEKFNFNGKDFIIMVNNPQLADPFSDSFEGLYQREKQESQRAVEEKYNIKVVYKSYEPNPSWGVPRDNFIINYEITGQPQAQVYSIPTSSIPTLASAGVIAPVEAYYEEYAHEEFAIKQHFLKFKEHYYGYDDGYPHTNFGLYYNQNLLEELGYAADYPTQLWEDGEWTWTKFESFVKELNTKLNEQNGQYPMGGILYDWAYGMVPANGGYFLNDAFETGVNTPETIGALENLAGLYAIPGMWSSTVDFSYATEENFKKGKIVFNPGESWHTFDVSRMGGRDFKDLGFVPFPKGKQVVDGNAEYKTLVSIWGPATYVFSSNYDDTPEEYKHVRYSTETIFRIFTELMHFGDVQDTFIDLSVNFLKYYADEASVDAHMSVIDKAYNEYFMGLGENSFGWSASNYNVQINTAISSNNVRAQMTMLDENMKAAISAMLE
ncbi:MAG: putative carbohydrate transporter-like, substrate-binding component [Haloplasmataceae bacterium]|jgi:maltose-binding protein MalE|nr:putative carbohydrate transporter-like, substrate-binding component [Haloplasmataceae bacterium]